MGRNLDNFVALLKEVYNEEAWNTYSACFPPCKSPEASMGDDVWSVLRYHISPEDEGVFNWLEQRVPALYGATPRSLLQMEDGDKVLKAFLMRIPC